jgi:hypothetical protein
MLSNRSGHATPSRILFGCCGRLCPRLCPRFGQHTPVKGPCIAVIVKLGRVGTSARHSPRYRQQTADHVISHRRFGVFITEMKRIYLVLFELNIKGI